MPSSSTETSQHNSKESQRHDSTVNPEELTNQVLELDDPSQTLASSLHAVDIPSFVESPSGLTSPSPADQTNRGGMETSFTSPVLGELYNDDVEDCGPLFTTWARFPLFSRGIKFNIPRSLSTI